jgi:hypothetical protein
VTVKVWPPSWITKDEQNKLNTATDLLRAMSLDGFQPNTELGELCILFTQEVLRLCKFGHRPGRRMSRRNGAQAQTYSFCKASAATILARCSLISHSKTDFLDMNQVVFYENSAADALLLYGDQLSLQALKSRYTGGLLLDLAFQCHFPVTAIVSL